jgi:hemoglobin/transferrin/lactoferrin receptor protein
MRKGNAVAVLAALLTAGSGLAWGQAKDPATEPDAVTSTATRSERSIFDTPGTVSVIDQAEIDRRNVQSIRDLGRYEPGVSVSNNPLRTGAGGFTIRGIGQNRVLYLLDGIRVPDFPVNSQPGIFTRDFIDVENLKRVEIVRGASSALYGSDAIGGVVAYITKDPADYLTTPGKDWFVSLKGAYSQADHSFAETATVAARAGWAEAMALYTRRDGHNLGNNGGIDANPQDTRSHNVLTKLVLRPTTSDTVRLIGDYAYSNADTEVLSDRGVPTPGTTVTDSDNGDRNRRYRLSAEHVHAAPLGPVDKLTWRVGYQTLDRLKHTDQTRTVGASRRLRVTDQNFLQDIVSGDIELVSTPRVLGIDNRLTYGASLVHTDTTRPRDRTEFNFTARTSTKVVSGETFPKKTFPDTESWLGGAFIQDEVEFFGGRVSLLPALRVDYYRLDPSPDAAANATNPAGRPFTSVSDAAVSPKLGGIFRIDPVNALYAQYARGFRAPPYDDANIAFSNPIFGYEILPNPNLKAETSDGFELGWRGKWADGSSAGVSGFYNIYHDFINQVVIGTSAAGLIQFQPRNLQRVHIFGAEARGRWQATDTVALIGSFAYAKGRDDVSNLPIDSVDPVKAVAGIRYDNPDNWGAELTGIFAARHFAVSNEAFLKAPAYASFDLTGYWHPVPNLSFNLGLFNALDHKYFVAPDVIGVMANRADIGRFTQPGRYVGGNTTVRF